MASEDRSYTWEQILRRYYALPWWARLFVKRPCSMGYPVKVQTAGTIEWTTPKNLWGSEETVTGTPDSSFGVSIMGGDNAK